MAMWRSLAMSSLLPRLRLDERRDARKRIARRRRGGILGDEGMRLAFDLDELDGAAPGAIGIGEAVGAEVLDVRVVGALDGEDGWLGGRLVALDDQLRIAFLHRRLAGPERVVGIDQVLEA